MNPTGFLPTASLASFTRVMMDPTTGVEAEVPNYVSKVVSVR